MENLRVAKCCFSCNHSKNDNNAEDDEVLCSKYNYYAKKYHLCDSYSDH